jgi:hypothetical protein
MVFGFCARRCGIGVISEKVASGDERYREGDEKN